MRVGNLPPLLSANIQQRARPREPPDNPGATDRLVSTLHRETFRRMVGTAICPSNRIPDREQDRQLAQARVSEWQSRFWPESTAAGAIAVRRGRGERQSQAKCPH